MKCCVSGLTHNPMMLCFTAPLLLLLCNHNSLDLHSFPTRRSSDLWLIDDCPTACALPPVMPPVTTGAPHVYRVPRSEEHTSELQSRENLVCRLLLEKKNHKKEKVIEHYSLDN